MEVPCPKRFFRPPIPPQPCHRQAAADRINQALEKSDIAEICHAIGAASGLYNISDLPQKSGLARTNFHRSFAGGKIKPNFTTVLNVLDAMGFRLHVTMRGDAPARPARFKPVASCPEAGTKS
jgi:probable addiction module antidote protein